MVVFVSCSQSTPFLSFFVERLVSWSSLLIYRVQNGKMDFSFRNHQKIVEFLFDPADVAAGNAA